MINILIRTHERPIAFTRCIESIKGQTYKEVNLIVTTDTVRSHYYANQILAESGLPYKTVGQMPTSKSKFFYNLYCNTLIDKVNDGWLFFLDDDDVLAHNGAIEGITREFIHKKPVICQMLRHDKPKPSNKFIDEKRVDSGYIGLPCIAIHSDIKRANFTDDENADYQWIEQYAHDAVFVKKVLVNSKQRGHGKSE